MQGSRRQHSTVIVITSDGTVYIRLVDISRIAQVVFIICERVCRSVGF